MIFFHVWGGATRDEFAFGGAIRVPILGLWGEKHYV